MESQVKSKIIEEDKNLFNNNIINNGKCTIFQNYKKNSNNYNASYYKYNRRNTSRDNIYPIISNNTKSFKEKFINENETIFHDHNNYKNTFLINNSKDDKNYNFKTLNRNSSVGSLLNNKITKINVNKGLHKNKSTAELLNQKALYFFPLLKPRKIIIDYCCGPYELHVTDINKKNLNFKKYGHNTFFMGGNYNPQNYEIKHKNRISRNYYGKLFAN